MSRFILFLIVVASFTRCKVSDYASEAEPVDHTIWDSLVRQYVNEEGWVDYNAFLNDTARLNKYLVILSKAHPNDDHWTREQRLAYWINAYNAYTVKLILDHYPVQSIKDIKKGIPFVNSVWDIKFIKIEERIYDLNQIEHGILRKKFDEPRIHFAINCASYSCPVLRNEAFVATRLDAQLENATVQFLNDERKNIISKQEIKISKIFKWFKGDFTEGRSLIEFIDPYVDIDLTDETKITFVDYNWELNDARIKTQMK